MEEFFKKYYLSMCRYVSSFDFNPADVEEQLSETILKRFDEYLVKTDGNLKTVKHWINRRVLLDLTRKRSENFKYRQSVEFEEIHHGSDLNDPAEILDLKQRLPNISPILIRYEAHAPGNKKSDVSWFCRERKKLYEALGTDRQSKWGSENLKKVAA